MTKKHFIALADSIKIQRLTFNQFPSTEKQDRPFTTNQVECLANFCQSQNPRFDRARWIGYINGDNGPNGGKVKAAKETP